MKNLIIGLCVGYPLATLKPFLASWRALEDVDLCLFVADLDMSAYRLMESAGVILRDARPYLASDHHVQSSRLYMYRAAMTEFAGEYHQFMLSDIADVYLQSDPFQELPPGDLFFTEEPCLLALSKANQRWFLEAGGVAMTQCLSGYPVLCGGTTIGSAKGVGMYLDRVIQLIVELGINMSISGIDQATHNMVARLNPPANTVVLKNSAPVATMNYMTKEQYVFDNGRLLDLEIGKEPAVVHQWNRKPDIADRVRAHFSNAGITPRSGINPRFGFDIVAFGEDWSISAHVERARLFLGSLEAAGFTGRVFLEAPSGLFRDVDLDLVLLNPPDNRTDLTRFIRRILPGLDRRVLLCAADRTCFQFAPEQLDISRGVHHAGTGAPWRPGTERHKILVEAAGPALAEKCASLSPVSARFVLLDRSILEAVLARAGAERPDHCPSVLWFEACLAAHLAAVEQNTKELPLATVTDVAKFHPTACQVGMNVTIAAAKPTALLSWWSVPEMASHIAEKFSPGRPRAG